MLPLLRAHPRHAAALRRYAPAIHVAGALACVAGFAALLYVSTPGGCIVMSLGCFAMSLTRRAVGA
jgi:hypothetical protein